MNTKDSTIYVQKWIGKEIRRIRRASTDQEAEGIPRTLNTQKIIKSIKNKNGVEDREAEVALLNNNIKEARVKIKDNEEAAAGTVNDRNSKRYPLDDEG